MFFLHNLIRNTDWKADLGGLVSKEFKERCFLCAEGPAEISTSFPCPKWDKRVKCGNKCWEAERWAENGQNAACKTDPGNQLCWHQSRGQVVSEGWQWDLCCWWHSGCVQVPELGQAFSWAGLYSINPNELNWENTDINQMLPPLSLWKIIENGKVPNTSQCSFHRFPPIL